MGYREMRDDCEGMFHRLDAERERMRGVNNRHENVNRTSAKISRYLAIVGVVLAMPVWAEVSRKIRSGEMQKADVVCALLASLCLAGSSGYLGFSFGDDLGWRAGYSGRCLHESQQRWLDAHRSRDE